MQTFRPHPTPGESESQGQSPRVGQTCGRLWCDLESPTSLITPTLHVAMETEVGCPQVGTWKGSGSSQFACVYFPNQTSETALETLQNAGSEPPGPVMRVERHGAGMGQG